MSDPAEYGREVNEFINQFCIVEEHKPGKWMAYLDPAHDFVREGLQPPGQVNFYEDGNPTYSVGHIYWDGQPPTFKRKQSGKWQEVWSFDLSIKENRVLWNEAWAARPLFASAWTAREKIEAWVRQNRPDITHQAKVHAREALAYRRRTGGENV